MKTIKANQIEISQSAIAQIAPITSCQNLLMIPLYGLPKKDAGDNDLWQTTAKHSGQQRGLDLFEPSGTVLGRSNYRDYKPII